MEQFKKYHDKLNQESLIEIYQELPETFIQFTNSEIINHCLHGIKVGMKSEQSARVLNNWINSGIVMVDEEDKGKIRRFNRIESIWLSVVVEARKFGIPLDTLKQSRKDLTTTIENFSLLKFSIIDTLMRTPKILMILEEGYAKIIPVDLYSKKINRGNYPTHIFFKLMDFISIEYPNNAFNVDFNISDPYESIEKMTLLYFLKTGDYKSIHLQINAEDIRLIENSNSLAKNKDLMNVISSWNFSKAEIILTDGVKATITL